MFKGVAADARRIIVGVSGSLASLAALCAAAAEARRGGGRLIAVLAWTPVGGEVSYRRAPCPQLLQMWEELAADRLRNAFDAAFGGEPPDLSIHRHVVRGAPGPVLAAVADRPDDLLVIGTGARGRLRRVLHGSVSPYCLAHVGCPILAVPPPEMIREARHHHHWRLAELTVTNGQRR